MGRSAKTVIHQCSGASRLCYVELHPPPLPYRYREGNFGQMCRTTVHERAKEKRFIGSMEIDSKHVEKLVTVEPCLVIVHTI